MDPNSVGVTALCVIMLYSLAFVYIPSYAPTNHMQTR